MSIPREQAHRERLEIDYWSQSTEEAPGSDSLDAFTNKMAEARVVLEKLDSYAEHFHEANTILEIGGGQCWISCMIKKQFGADKVVVGSDIAPEAVASLPEWERIFLLDLDGAAACRSYELPLRAESVDLVVVFAAAHHFGAHGRTLAELSRVLTPGGRVMYLHEPGCRRYIHWLARRRVMAKRPVVPEDVLVYRRLAQLAARNGLATDVIFAPTTTYRAAFETIYYLVLRRVRLLQHVLPCSVDIIFTKPGGEPRRGTAHTE
jgi:SAM-dependent methyltransferase